MTVYYIDANRGSDSNDGTSTASPWQNLSMIPTITGATAGDEFRLASDSIWTPSHTTRMVPPATWSGTERSPVLIGKYDPPGVSGSGKPTIRWNRNTERSDWTETASPGCWVYANAGSYLFTNSCLIRLANSWLASCVDTVNSAALVSASAVPGRYYASSTNLWLYSPTGVNPVDYYGSVVVSPAASGYIGCSSGRKWITVEDLHFEDTGCGVLLYSGSSVEVGFRARRISGKTVSNLIGANADATGVLRAWIHDCDIRDFGALAIISSCNGDGLKWLEIYNNRIDDGVHCWAQGGIYLTSRSTGVRPLIHHNHVTRCRWGTRDKSVDGSAIYAETKSDDALIYGNLIEHCYAAFQDNSGRKATFAGNIVRNCRLGMRITDQAGVGSTDHRSYNNTFIVGDVNQTPTEFGGTQGQEYTGFWMYKPSGAFAVTAKNNIICDVTGSNRRAAFGLPDTTGTMSLDGNWVYGYTYDTMTASNNGSGASSLTNIGETDPRPYLDIDAMPIADGYNLADPNPLADAGSWIQGTPLRNGRARPGWTPAGACQGMVPRAARSA